MITRRAFRANANTLADGYLVKQLIGAGLQWLEHNRDLVNRLNVFPVPDGDTGTNMHLTMRGAYMEIANMEETNVGKLARAVAEGALKGARGNSGVILSQILAGTAKSLEGHDKLNAKLFADACKTAAEYAYNAVEKPVEGTILTVSRHMAMAVEKAHAEGQEDLIVLMKRMVFAGRAALRRTPEMMPLLKKAGVVDSGGQGLVFIFEGMLRALCGKALTAEATSEVIVPEKAETWEDALVPEDELGYGYDVQFLMRGENMSIEKVRADIQAMGWSTLVVGDNSLIKVHVHVHNPADPLGYAITSGASLDDIVVENMQRQYEDYVASRAAKDSGPLARTDIKGVAVVTVANGVGLKRLFHDQFNAAYVITGGQTMNPSTGDFETAIAALPNDEIILLPNNKNVLLAAKQAAERAQDKRVHVVPSFFIPQGIAAMFEYINVCGDEQAPCEIHEVAEAMTAALTHVVTCELTYATRDVDLGDVQVGAGQIIGLINDNLVVSGDHMLTVATDLLSNANASRKERITLYYGSDSSMDEAKKLVAGLQPTFSKQEFEIVEGGQALYPYIISVE
ncbi:MAG: DAK2 domain-containing protein [Pleurocapsa minor GSE-CHR-MK-17-07R]|jgi:DAK2 domain fusion protein YloV|nr:DAK2 domain-containing protein [Pleurocapsa minor GSE-CHR-MK 17-07R]